MATLKTLLVKLGMDTKAFKSGVNRGLAGLDSLVSRAAKLNSVAKAGGLAILGGQAVQLTAALVPAAGAILALPAAMATAKAAALTLKVGMAGVGEAMSAVAEGDSKKLQEALKELSPAAAAFVKETASLKAKAFDPLRAAVQDKLFDRLVGPLKTAAAAVLPTAKAGMVRVAGAINGMGREALRVAATPFFRGQLAQVFTGTAKTATILKRGVEPLIAVVLRLSNLGLPLVQRMAGWAVEGVKSAAAFLKSKDGAEQMAGIVQRAGDTLATLGRIGKNIGVGLAGFFKGANTEGGGLLSTIQQLTARFAAWAQSAQGQEQIGQVFTFLSQAAAALGPILGLLVGPLGAVVGWFSSLPAPVQSAAAQALAFTVVAGAIASKLGPVVTGVAALAGGIRKAVPAIKSMIGASKLLVVAIRAIGAAIAGNPIGLIITGLILLGTALYTAYQESAKFREIVDGVFSFLKQAYTTYIQPFIAGIGELIGAIINGDWGRVGELLRGAAQQVVTWLGQVGESIGKWLSDLPGWIAGKAAVLGESLLAWIKETAPKIPPALEQLGHKIAEWAKGLPDKIRQWIGNGEKLINWLKEWGPKIAAGLALAVGVAVLAIPTIMASLAAALLYAVGVAIAELAKEMRAKFDQAMAQAGKAVQDGAAKVITWFKGLPGRVKTALGNLGTLLLQAGKDVVAGLINGIQAKAGELAAAAKGLADQIIGTVTGKQGVDTGSPSRVFDQIGRWTVQGLIQGLTAEQGKAVDVVKRMVEKIKAAFGSKPDVADHLIAFVTKGNDSLAALAKQREDLVARLAEAKEKAKTIAGDAKDWASITGLTEEELNSGNFAGALKDRAQQIKDFANNIKELAKRGLNKETLRQIIDAGVEGGGSLAEMLVGAPGSEIKAINKAQAQIDKLSKTLGKTGADALYDVGSKAGAGYLKGLQDSLAKLDAEMTKIVKALVKAIKKELKIKSPSQVMADIGMQTIAGLALGITSAAGQALGAIAGVAASVTGQAAAGLADDTFGLAISGTDARQQAVARSAGSRARSDSTTPGTSGGVTIQVDMSGSTIQEKADVPALATEMGYQVLAII
ncbi:hypothetical protein OHA25_08495 [Nonomuraea sp. NBC_00507]|uniref:hypothetical protein n=1 Tax=Nonomuraea sp. NBC_00507 TaxID=2976002 RepID=UPI002E17D1ED